MYCFVLRMGGGLGAYSAHGQAKQRLRAKRISQLEYGPPGLGNQVFGAEAWEITNRTDWLRAGNSKPTDYVKALQHSISSGDENDLSSRAL